MVRGGGYTGCQGGIFTGVVSAETAGAQGLCLLMLELPPGTRAQPHVHASHESAVMIISGTVDVWHGPGLADHVVLQPGDCLLIPADVPHLPINIGSDTMLAVVARTDPREQESVRVLDLPEHLADYARLPVAGVS